MRLGNVFPSEFLKSSDLGGFGQHREYRVRINDVKMWEDQQGNRKLSIGFEKTEKRLLANITNARTIAKAFGDETDAWIGKTVILFVQMVDFKGDSVEAIRVRVPPVPPQPTQAALPPNTYPSRPSHAAASPAPPNGNDPAGNVQSAAAPEQPPAVQSYDDFGIPPTALRDDMDDEIPF